MLNVTICKQIHYLSSVCFAILVTRRNSFTTVVRRKMHALTRLSSSLILGRKEQREYTHSFLVFVADSCFENSSYETLFSDL